MVTEEDDEDLALTLNGKKRKIKRRDFEISMAKAGMEAKVIENIFKKFKTLMPEWLELIELSFLPEEE